jgi:hypothetical protein
MSALAFCFFKLYKDKTHLKAGLFFCPIHPDFRLNQPDLSYFYNTVFIQFAANSPILAPTDFYLSAT